MTYFESIILGLTQGLAEFLPISSSGHLALLQQWFGIEEDKVLLFAVLLHVGTLISVFIVYWRDIWELIVELFLTIKDIFTGKGLRLKERPVRKLGVMLSLIHIWFLAVLLFVCLLLLQSQQSRLLKLRLPVCHVLPEKACQQLQKQHYKCHLPPQVFRLDLQSYLWPLCRKLVF